MKLQMYHKMYVLTFGKLFEVVHVAKDAEEANQFMSENPDTALIDEDQTSGLCYLAKLKPTLLENVELA